MSNKKIWIRAGISLHTELEPEEITEEILVRLIKDKHWKLDGETLVYQDIDSKFEIKKELNF